MLHTAGLLYNACSLYTKIKAPAANINLLNTLLELKCLLPTKDNDCMRTMQVTDGYMSPVHRVNENLQRVGDSSAFNFSCQAFHV